MAGPGGSKSDTIRYVNATLPPGPTTPRPLQTVRWIVPPGPMLEDCRGATATCSPCASRNEGNWVLLSDPEAIKQVFTGDPRVLHAGEANVVLLPVLGPQLACCCSTRPRTCAAQADAAAVPRRAHARLRQLMAEVAEPRRSTRWPAGEPLAAPAAMQAVTLEVIMRAVFGVQDDASARRGCARPAERRSSGQRPAPDGDARGARAAAASRARDCSGACDEPADELIYEEIRERRRRPTSPSATTSCRCCCRPATRTAAR